MWLLLHFDAVIKAAVARSVDSEKDDPTQLYLQQQLKQQQQTLAMLLGPTLQMSHRLLVTLLTHSTVLFPDTVLAKWVLIFSEIIFILPLLSALAYIYRD